MRESTLLPRLKVSSAKAQWNQWRFGDGTIPAAFTLKETKISPLGVIIATYVRNGEVKTGTFVPQ